MTEDSGDTQTAIRDWRNDPRTNEELLHAALSKEDEDLAWDAIMTLYWRGSPETFEAARQLCASADAHERCVGARILGQLDVEGNQFHDESVTTLLGMLEHEQDPDVLHAVCTALSHREDPRAIEALARLKHHPEWKVRFSVTHGLWGFEDERAINALIELSTDPDEVIRDWATTGLGLLDTDTPQIRAALLARLTDEDAITRGEALVALAQRHDQRALEPLMAELELVRTRGLKYFGDDALSYGELLCRAAALLGDARLYPLLVRWRKEWKGKKTKHPYEDLKDAIEACRPPSEP